MKVKKHQLFFWVGLALFIASLAFYLVGMGLLVREAQTETLPPSYPSDIEQYRQEAVYATFVYIVLVGPSLLVELSCIRSVYRILKYEPKGIIRICWLVSAVLSFFAFVFQILVHTGVLAYMEYETPLILSEFPVAIVSFLLCSIRKKQDHDKKQDHEGSNV